MKKTKEDMSKEINKALPIEYEIDFTKLTKEDLVVFHQLVKDPKKFVRELITKKGQSLMSEVVSDITKGKGDKIGEGKIIKRVLEKLA